MDILNGELYAILHNVNCERTKTHYIAMNIIELTDTQEYEITFNQSLALSLSLARWKNKPWKALRNDKMDY